MRNLFIVGGILLAQFNPNNLQNYVPPTQYYSAPPTYLPPSSNYYGSGTQSVPSAPMPQYQGPVGCAYSAYGC